jgi:ABC-type nitrate/sulfonate/bicarbonate transport system substrate-binding protein
VSDSLIAENEDLVRRMVEATTEAQADALANATPDEIYQLVLAEDPQANEEAVKLTWADVQTYIIDPGPMNDETFEFQLDVIARGGTATDLTPADLYTNEYIPAG